jgi:hypothetical protein
MKKLTRDIDIKKAPTGDLVKWYNENSGVKPIAKFKDRATAEKRCAELKQAVNELSNTNGGTKGAAKAAKAEKAPKASKKGETSEVNGKTRKSASSDKTIHRAIDPETKKPYENPRREGTHGHKSWSVIKDGMSYADFIAAGGRAVDLRHDVNQGRLVLK